MPAKIRDNETFVVNLLKNAAEYNISKIKTNPAILKGENGKSIVVVRGYIKLKLKIAAIMILVIKSDIFR
ncbi:MAG: hypothetical protein GX660_09595 [Clostridiaceae bacterium]|nr:hypothetical protein [Clostridiaceae bacterium]